MSFCWRVSALMGGKYAANEKGMWGHQLTVIVLAGAVVLHPAALQAIKRDGKLPGTV